MRKIFILIFCLFTFNVNSMEKETTFNKELFDKAQSDGKVVIVSSWIKYCSSCASQMKVLNKAKNEFENVEYFTFDVTNKEIAKLFDVQYQTTLLIFKGDKEVYRSIGETSKDLIYKAIQSSIQELNLLIFKIIVGKNVATTKDRNNKDCDMKGANDSFGIKIPINKLFEKSGIGNNKKPPTNPNIIAVQAVFSLIFLLQKL